MRLLLISFVLFSTHIFAQIGTGQWRLHVPARQGIDVAAVDGKIYTAFRNGVSEYDITSKEVTLWDAVNGLSDITVSCLGMSPNGKAVFIGYENGNIDKIEGNTVTNIPAIRLAQVQGSKKIHSIVEYDGYMFFSTGFAIVKIDPIKDEVKDSYYPTNGNDPILDVRFQGDSIYALTEDRLLKGLISNVALADPTQWEVDNRVPVLTSDAYKELEVANDELYLLYKGDGYGEDTVYQVTDSGLDTTFYESFPAIEISSLNVCDDKLVVNFGAAIEYNDDWSYSQIIASLPFGSLTANATICQDGVYWIADQYHGLVRFEPQVSATKISFSGPPKESFYSMDWSRDRLVVTGGGVSDNLGTFNSSGMYMFEGEEWTLLDQNTTGEWGIGRAWDFLSVSMNPNNKDQMAVGGYSRVPLAIFDGSLEDVDTLTPLNSPIEPTSFGNGLSLVSDVKYDTEGNLWVLNGVSNNPLKVYTAGGEWNSFETGTLSKSKFSRKLEIDYNGTKWFALRAGGLYGYNDAGTPMSTNDDQYIHMTNGEQSGALPSNEVTAIAVDFDNEIWIGTDAGFAVLYNAETAIEGTPGEYNAQRIKLEFEGNVEYVLGATSITDIVVDGANRKWFGTANAGIILLSADGLEILEQYTTENSPLISNNILDLELDNNTGELYIITNKGLISYRTDATYGDAEYSNVKVFPNPARPDFDGPITMQGIQYDSDVKITDIAGNVVFQTTSNGGTATWDGKTLTGDRVKTGVYLIWTAPNDGKGRQVGKVLIVN